MERNLIFFKVPNRRTFLSREKLQNKGTFDLVHKKVSFPFSTQETKNMETYDEFLRESFKKMYVYQVKIALSS